MRCLIPNSLMMAFGGTNSAFLCKIPILNPIKTMKNHIMQAIIDTAKNPTNREGMAAINQLILEVTSEFPEVAPSGFGFQETRMPGKETAHHYYLHAALIDPWPLDSKGFCGNGSTLHEAMRSLRKELTAYFVPVDQNEVLVCTKVQTFAGQSIPDRRTEFAA